MSRPTSPTVLQFPLRKSFVCTSPSFTVLDESDGNVRRRLMFEFMPSAQSCSHDECVIKTSYYAHILLYNIYIYTYVSLYANINNIYMYILLQEKRWGPGVFNSRVESVSGPKKASTPTISDPKPQQPRSSIQSPWSVGSNQSVKVENQ